MKLIFNPMVRVMSLRLALVASTALTPPAFADSQTWAVPGAIDAAGNKVLTVINKDPPGVRCNGNTQVAVEIANTYRVPIQIIPASLAPGFPASSVFYGRQLIVADGKDHNGQSSFQIVADMLDIEDAPKQPKNGLIYQEKVRKDFDALKAVIKSGGR